MDMNNLLTEIAIYRCEMNRFSKGKSLTDPDVIKLSEGLDLLIYKYLDFRLRPSIGHLSDIEREWH